MFDRPFKGTPRHSDQAAALPFFAALVFLALTILGLEARADDGQSVSAPTASSPALLQMARSASSVEQYEEAGTFADQANFDAVRPRDEIEPVSQGLNLDLEISLEGIAGLQATAEDGKQNTARTARIASCHEASLGRYRSEEHGEDFTNPLSRTTELDTAVTHFTARRASRQQFDTCSR